MNEARDTLVGDALRRLDLPDHGPDFWAGLDARLVEVPGSGEQPEPDGSRLDAEVVELGDVRTRVPTGPARPSRIPAFAVAAAAVAAIALVVGVAVLRPAADDESRVDVADTPERSTAPDPEAGVEADPAPTAPQVPARSPEALAAEWLRLLRDGDVDRAHALLDESSRAVLSVEQLRDVASGLAGGAGAFADLDRSVIPLIDDEGLAATAVVFTGDVQREGMVETASHAVVVTGDPEDPSRSLGVAFVLNGPTVEAVQRTRPSETRTSPLELELSPTAGATWAIVDGASPVRIDAGEPVVTVDVEALAGPGTHTVAVVSTEAGLYTARSFTVVVP